MEVDGFVVRVVDEGVVSGVLAHSVGLYVDMVVSAWKSGFGKFWDYWGERVGDGVVVYLGGRPVEFWPGSVIEGVARGVFRG